MIDLSQLEALKTDQDLEKESESAQALAYLQSTDWYASRLADTGKPIPADVKQARADAREKVIK